MITYCNTEELKIFSDVEPCPCVRTALKSLPEEVKKEIKEKPYLNKKRVAFSIYYGGEQYSLLFGKGYDWDGATIPIGFRWLTGSKGKPEFLIPSMVHDKLCENHGFIKNNRYLSSLIFRELLIACGVCKFLAYTMFHAVDNFQKVCGGWD